jgi:hypothetical protein
VFDRASLALGRPLQVIIRLVPINADPGHAIILYAAKGSFFVVSVSFQIAGQPPQIGLKRMSGKPSLPSTLDFQPTEQFLPSRRKQRFSFSVGPVVDASTAGYTAISITD